MNSAMIKRLILKDWYLHRLPILLSLAGGAASMAIVFYGGKAGFMLGIILLVTVLVSIGATLTVNMTVLERKEQTLAFIMSLPVSYRDYTASKLLGVLAIFLIPWTMFMAGGLALLALGPGMQRGLAPYVAMMGLEILASTCLIAAVGLITESQGWTITAVMIGNLALNGIGYLLAHLAPIAKDMYGPVARWSPVSLALLLGEAGTILLILGGTFLVQSRKRDFL